MSQYRHIEVFLDALTDAADVDDIATGAAIVKTICAKLDISILKERVRGGPETYYFHLEFPSDLHPKRVFVKSIYHGSELSSKYDVLSSLRGFDQIMPVYGISQYWLVCALIPELNKVTPNIDLTPLQRVLCAIDALVYIHKLDIEPLSSNDLFQKESLTIESLNNQLIVAQKRVAKEEIDNDRWCVIFSWLVDNYELHFPLFSSFNENMLVIHHGDFHHLNFTWRYYEAIKGWSCIAIDWDTIALRVPWADIAYLLIPNRTNVPAWQYDDEAINHYAQSFGIYGDNQIQELLSKYYQYRIWQGLFNIVKDGTQALEVDWLTFFEYYVDKLRTSD